MPVPTDDSADAQPDPTHRSDVERADLLDTLAKHRAFLRFTVRDLNDEQAAQRTTVSELCLGGLIKHVAAVEGQWAEFIERGPAAIGAMDDAALEAHAAQHQDPARLPNRVSFVGRIMLDAWRLTLEQEATAPGGGRRRGVRRSTRRTRHRSPGSGRCSSWTARRVSPTGARRSWRCRR